MNLGFVTTKIGSYNRLSYLTFDDLVFCAEQMLDQWTVGSVEGSSG